VAPPGETYQSDALAAIHETASDLHAGVMEKRTLREFNELCLMAVGPSAVTHRAIPELEGK